MTDPLSELFEGVRRGEEASFAELYRRTARSVRFYLYSRGLTGEELEEVMAESYLTVFEKARKFRGRSQVLTWIIGIVNLKCREFFRKRKRRESALPEAPDLCNYEVQAALSADLKAAIASLDREEYVLFVYRFCLCMRYEEMSKILKVPVGTLRQNVRVLRNKLMDRLRERG